MSKLDDDGLLCDHAAAITGSSPLRTARVELACAELAAAEARASMRSAMIALVVARNELLRVDPQAVADEDRLLVRVLFRHGAIA